MIGYIKGTIEEILEDSLLLDHQGIGYQIKVPQGMLSSLSIGTEHIDDIIADLEKGFAAAK